MGIVAILAVFDEETRNVLAELEETVPVKDALICLKTITRSSKLLGLEPLLNLESGVMESIEESG